MTVKKAALLSPQQLKALKTTDLSPLIRMSDMMAPRILKSALATLNEKERAAIDKVLPVGGEKRIYVQLVGTPTPPIVMGLAQPPKMSIMSEQKVKEQSIKGIKLTVDDLQAASEGKMLKLIWRIKGQIFTILGISGAFMPLIKLGPSGLKELSSKMKAHFKPMLDLLPHT